jgi:hypothetical protein
MCDDSPAKVALPDMIGEKCTDFLSLVFRIGRDHRRAVQA